MCPIAKEGVCPTGKEADGKIADGSIDERYWITRKAAEVDPRRFTVGVCPTAKEADAKIADDSIVERYGIACKADEVDQRCFTVGVCPTASRSAGDKTNGSDDASQNVPGERCNW